MSSGLLNHTHYGDMYAYYMSIANEDLIDLCKRRLVLSSGPKTAVVARLVRQDRQMTATYANL